MAKRTSVHIAVTEPDGTVTTYGPYPFNSDKHIKCMAKAAAAGHVVEVHPVLKERR